MFANENNDLMSSLRGIDLKEMILYIENYILEYRKSLGLPQDVTFGLELEYENLSKGKVDSFVERYLRRWDSGSDSTVSGGEIRSPVLHDDDAWKELKLICDFLKIKGATTNKAGGHIHVGAHILGDDARSWLEFLKLYTAYEHVLFRFFYGDKLNARSSLIEYAPPISDLFHKELSTSLNSRDIPSVRYILNRCSTGKSKALNLNNVNRRLTEYQAIMNTIEFRVPNATVYEVIEQNNVNTATKMLVASKQKVINVDFLDYKLKHEFHSYNENKNYYNEICLKDALEFVDLVFDRNIDKLYFLRQYLKDFSSNYKLKEPAKAKIFYKVA